MILKKLFLLSKNWRNQAKKNIVK